jgi:hypothetical protein
MLVHLLKSWLEHLKSHDLKVALLKAFNNLTNKALADTVWLYQHKRLLFLSGAA